MEVIQNGSGAIVVFCFSITLNLNLHSVTLTYFLGEFHLQLFVDTFAPKLYQSIGHGVAQMVICFPVTLDN